uniref:Uncharacterized protein n=1 Tax=Panagrolaimus superbus TaxID=310955 RepID=A0A914YJ75_9BILA
MAPELGTHALTQALGQCLGEAVGEGLQQDRVVVVMLGLEARDVRVDADAGSDRERADPVLLATVGGRDEVGQAEIRALGRLVHLLAQEVQGGFALRVLHADVVADAVGRPQAEHGLGRQPLLADDALEHRAGIAVQLAGLGADDLVGEDGRELAGQLPGLEERRPVDVEAAVGRLQRRNVHASGLVRCRWRVAVPAALEFLPARMFQRDQALGVAAVAVACADFGIVGFVGGDEGLAQVARDQRLRHAHRARGIPSPHTRGVPCSGGRSSAQCARARWWRRRSAVAGRSPGAPSRGRRGSSPPATG